jgi:hypothetical protein
MVVFDRANNYYHQFALWTTKLVFFVIRIKKNFLYTVVEVLREHPQPKKAFSVVASLVRMYLKSLPDVFELLRSAKRKYLKKRGSPPSTMQTSFAF